MNEADAGRSPHDSQVESLTDSSAVPGWATFEEMCRTAYTVGLVCIALGIPTISIGVLLWPVSGGLVDPAPIVRGFGSLLIFAGVITTVGSIVAYQLTRQYTVESTRGDTA